MVLSGIEERHSKLHEEASSALRYCPDDLGCKERRKADRASVPKGGVERPRGPRSPESWKAGHRMQRSTIATEFKSQTARDLTCFSGGRQEGRIDGG